MRGHLHTGRKSLLGPRDDHRNDRLLVNLLEGGAQLVHHLEGDHVLRRRIQTQARHTVRKFQRDCFEFAQRLTLSRNLLYRTRGWRAARLRWAPALRRRLQKPAASTRYLRRRLPPKLLDEPSASMLPRSCRRIAARLWS